MICEVYTRIFVADEALDRTVDFYSTILRGTVSLRFSDPNTGLTLAAVSSPKLSVLIIAGPPEARRPYEATALTVKVENLDENLPVVTNAGAVQLEPIQPTPVGRKTRFRHPDGLIVEYVDHKPPPAPAP